MSVAVAVVAVVALLWHCSQDNTVAVSSSEHTAISPTQIESIEQIGEWEFLAVSDEEMIDTVSHGIFGDSQLTRIYYGTLRLGINLREARPGWISVDADTVVAVLPPVRLLDNDFIDEARTRTFYESGSWKESDRKALYDRAYRKMLSRCLTESNLRSARHNASMQVSALLHNMGFKYVKVRVSAGKKNAAAER